MASKAMWEVDPETRSKVSQAALPLFRLAPGSGGGYDRDGD